MAGSQHYPDEQPKHPLLDDDALLDPPPPPPPPAPGKPWYQSKTLYLNALALVIAILAMPELLNVLPVTALPWITMVIAVLNMVNRFATTEPLTR